MTSAAPCILLVEDNADDAAIAVAALRDHASTHQIVVVVNGAEARDFLNGVGAYSHRNVCNTPDLVLLDVKIPRVGGLEVLRGMRNQKETRGVPVVILSCSDEEADVIVAYETGANSYVRKPVNYDDFRRAIREVSRYWLTVNRSPPKPAPHAERGERESR